MPDEETLERAREDAAEGKAPSTQAERDVRKGQEASRRKTSAKRSRATSTALKREGFQAASPGALAKQARQAARRRGRASRRQAARKAAQTRRRTGR